MQSPSAPRASDALLCLSGLAANWVLHSNSRRPGGTFTVRAESPAALRAAIEHAICGDDDGP